MVKRKTGPEKIRGYFEVYKNVIQDCLASLMLTVEIVNSFEKRIAQYITGLRST